MRSIRLSRDTLVGPDGNPVPGVITSLHELQKAGFTLSVNVSDDAADKTDVTEKPKSAIPHQLFMNEGITFREVVNNHHTVVRDTGKNQLVLISENKTESFNNWRELTIRLISPARTGLVQRNTRETNISVKVNLDGTGEFSCDTGLGFFDHMLEQISRHGGIDLNIKCDGDLHVDEHHTIEDVALALGSALDQAFGDRRGIERYGFVLPMDESRATVALDLSGRPFLVFKAQFTREKVGDLPTEMIRHFFYSLAMNLRATLHIEVSGDNDHHMIEASFKGLARCLKTAKQRTGDGIPSSKGVL
jgi:imidazoleglycerol phosphate dehydratase HisB